MVIPSRRKCLTLLLGAALGPRLPASAAYRKAQAGYEFSFPRDHGSHPDFQIEWWYLTGHLWTTTGRRFGFLATFFRSAIGEVSEQDLPLFRNGQGFLAHIGLLDATTGTFHVEERINRAGWDASAAEDDLVVRNGNWRLYREPQGDQTERLRLRTSILADALIDLTLVPTKPKVIFGKDGVSKKSATSDSASHYITFTRLQVDGTLQLLGETHRVEGQAWMDHEFSSSQLGPNQTGWDWASIQLDDGRELMLYQLRQANNQSDPFSKLTWISREGALTELKSGQWTWSARRQWTSPETKATYPIDFDLETQDPELGATLQLRLKPLQEAQEVIGKLDNVAYWEGACDVYDQGGQRVGRAYVELTGYDGRLSARLR